jgi:hypothetical protein
MLMYLLMSGCSIEARALSLSRQNAVRKPRAEFGVSSSNADTFDFDISIDVNHNRLVPLADMHHQEIIPLTLI